MSWQSPFPCLAPRYAVQGYIGGKWMTAGINLTNSGSKQPWVAARLKDLNRSFCSLSSG